MLWNEEETFAGLFGLLALGVAVYWLVARSPRRPTPIRRFNDGATGRRAAPYAPYPAAIEDRIDHVIDTLNERYGKDWGHMEVGALEAELHGVLPAALLSLLDVVHLVEEHAAQWGLSSSTKRWWAAHQVNRAALA